jgi:hypothetical protein
LQIVYKNYQLNLMGAIWELDFYSRPLLDEQGKKVWEMLLCESPTTTTQAPDSLFRYTQYCPSSTVNSLWLAEAIQTAIAQANASPMRIRFFRRQMNNMITKACKDIGITSSASRRTIVLQQWLDRRMRDVYPAEPNYQAPEHSPSVQMISDPPQPLPDALTGEKWAFVNLPAEQLEQMSEWSIGFGEAFPPGIVGVTPEMEIPGLLVFSARANPLAAWMSGLEVTGLRYQPAPQMSLLLESGASDSWILARLNSVTQAEAARFEQRKKLSKGVHFIAVQTNPETEEFAGFWLLYDP